MEWQLTMKLCPGEIVRPVGENKTSRVSDPLLTRLRLDLADYGKAKTEALKTEGISESHQFRKPVSGR